MKLPEFTRATSCFPLTEPGKFVSLLDNEGEEVALIEDLSTVAADERVLIEEALRAGGFLFQVRAVLTVEGEHEVRVWTVDTEQGKRRFQTRLDQWPRPLDTGGYLIQDICEDLYFVRDPAEMDEKSRELLFAFTG